MTEPRVTGWIKIRKGEISLTVSHVLDWVLRWRFQEGRQGYVKSFITEMSKTRLAVNQPLPPNRLAATTSASGRIPVLLSQEVCCGEGEVRVSQSKHHNFSMEIMFGRCGVETMWEADRRGKAEKCKRRGNLQVIMLVLSIRVGSVLPQGTLFLLFSHFSSLPVFLLSQLCSLFISSSQLTFFYLLQSPSEPFPLYHR